MRHAFAYYGLDLFNCLRQYAFILQVILRVIYFSSFFTSLQEFAVEIPFEYQFPGFTYCPFMLISFATMFNRALN